MMAHHSIRCGDKELVRGARTFVMGIVNVTPDSFSDGGTFQNPQAAIDHGLLLVAQGADVIDVGGCSTAPNAKPVSIDEELERVCPVIEGLRKRGISAISIDTTRAKVADCAQRLGASWINDQSAGLYDPEMPGVMARADGIVIMHNGGGVTSGVDAGESIVYPNVLEVIAAFFEERVRELARAGVDRNKLIVDPGVGFGKGLQDSLIIVNGMHRFAGIGAMSLVGLSRKSFIGAITSIVLPKDRDYASLGAQAAAIFSGADIIRTHNVRAAYELALVVDRCVPFAQNWSGYENLHQTR